MAPTILQTTIAGSLPKPAWLAPPRQLWAPWLLQEEALAEGKRAAVRLALREQERANSRLPLELLALLRGKDVLVGAIDVATEQVETPEQVASTIRAAMKYVAPDKLFPCTKCGMVPLARELAAAKLHALAAGAAIVRGEIGRNPSIRPNRGAQS